MGRVAVAKEVLRWAVGRSELAVDDLRDRFPKIQEWFTGKTQPTLRQLEELAKATLTPLGFLFLEKPPDERLPVPHYRTAGTEGVARPSPELIETVRAMQRRQDWMSEFLVEEGQEALSFVRSAKRDDQPGAIAERMRSAIGFGEQWAAEHRTWTDALRALREALENAGILVVVNGILGNNTHRRLDPEEFRGFVLVDEYAPLLFVNGTDGKAAQMFTLAHELAHVFLGQSAAFNLREMQPAREPIEQICNQAAAEFLVPGRLLSGIWPAVRKQQEPFQVIARQFKVSALVGARRALDLDLIRKDEFLAFYREYLKDERRFARPAKRGGNFFTSQDLRVGRRFASTVMRAAREGRLTYSEAYDLTGLYGKTYHRYAAKLGIERPA